ncbi:MAG: DUF5131 family protein [Kofleriaceae bacterium]
MGDRTGISWTDVTWNLIRGCLRVSEGCRNCYAERQAARIVRMAKGKPSAYDGLVRLVGGKPRWTGEVRFVPEMLALPLKWRKPRRIFVNSMSDLFHESLTNEQIAAVFGVMAAAPRHTFQVLTKRPARMREWFEWAGRMTLDKLQAFAYRSVPEAQHAASMAVARGRGRTWPLPNVWLGVSVEDQLAADERIPDLLRTPASVRFLSCEPLLDRVDLDGIQIPDERNWLRFSSLRRHHDDRYGQSDTTIDWVIAGCESGPGARPCSAEWLRSLRDQCAGASVPFFLKQAAGAPHDLGPVRAGTGSTRKPGGVIEMPYLDGVQHAAFPEVSHG